MPRPSQPNATPKVYDDHNQPLANLKTPAQAQAALEAHDAACPASYLACYGKPELNRIRLAWLQVRELLLSDLELAQKIDGATWRPVALPTPLEISPMPTAPPLHPRKTPGEKLTTMLDRLARLIAEDRGREASNLKCIIRRHCETEGLEVPAMPANPNPIPGIIRKEKTLQAVCAKVDQALGLPEGSSETAAHAVNHSPAVRTILRAGAKGALARRAQWMMIDASDLLREALMAEEATLSGAEVLLGNLDALVHQVYIYATEGRLQVGA
jgi:hypothetical protein